MLMPMLILLHFADLIFESVALVVESRSLMISLFYLILKVLDFLSQLGLVMFW